MNIAEKIIKKTEKVAVIGLGYVGLPLALEFAKKVDVIGFDLDAQKINTLQKGFDPIDEVGNEAVRASTAQFTSDETVLEQASFYIITVPTPIKPDKTPNLESVEAASRIVGSYISSGAYVIYESTVYPGVTEDFCIPLLEKSSGLTCGKDFKVGYSPERINPGDKVNTLPKITKIVSGIDETSLGEIAEVYELIITAGVHKADSIKVAEAAKVVENSQRDINIAFMNELAMVFDKMNIDTTSVIEAMATKWNALPFKPGLVGGHCIGIDPYYFIYEAERLGYHSQIILSGRKINDGMGKFVADSIITELIQANKIVKKAKVVILGLTFKENCTDIRNSKVIDIVDELRNYGLDPVVSDPLADKKSAYEEFQIDVTDLEDVSDADCVVFAVAHDCFQHMNEPDIDNLFAEMDNNEKVLIDIKSIINKTDFEKKGYRFWRL